jgi:hypothetical protein
MLTRKVQQGKHDGYIYCNRERHLGELEPSRLLKHTRYIADEKKEDMSVYQGREKINVFNFIYNNSYFTSRACDTRRNNVYVLM